MGWIFILVSVILFFLGGVGATIIPNPVTWGFFCLALGLLLGVMPPHINWK